MAKKITLTLELTVEERPRTDVPGLPDFGTAEELRRTLLDYLGGDPDADYPLMADFGPTAWGGYEGAYITAARVVSSAVTDASKEDA